MHHRYKFLGIGHAHKPYRTAVSVSTSSVQITGTGTVRYSGCGCGYDTIFPKRAFLVPFQTVPWFKEFLTHKLD